MRGRNLLALAALVLLALLAACSGSDQESAEQQSAQQWEQIEQKKDALDEKRAELAELEDELEAADAADDGDEEPAGDGAADGEGEEAADAMSPEELQAKIDDMRSTISSETDELYGEVVETINSSGLVEGEDLSEQQRKAFDMKAEIDILYAQEYIDRGGDYKRAIDIYSQALRSDPTNEKLLEAKAEAERLQYMNEERFSAVKKGMTQAEVRNLLGTVKNTNVREFNEQNRIGWFYRKVDGGAAGVYFKEKSTGSDEWVVEIADYDAIKPPAEGEDGEEAAE